MPDALFHIFIMAAFPVNTLALGAYGEFIEMLISIVRDFVFDRMFFYRFEQAIAFDTARKRFDLFLKAVCAYDMSELIDRLNIFDKMDAFFCTQTVIAGENDPVFFSGLEKNGKPLICIGCIDAADPEQSA